MVKWFNHHLKGEKNGVEADPAVRYYVMGAVGEKDAPGNVWRTVSDTTNRVMMFDSATAPVTFWVPLADLDLRPGAPVKKLELADGETYSGNAAGLFVEAKLFAFAPLSSGSVEAPHR